jgi:hypothetical protein
LEQDHERTLALQQPPKAASQCSFRAVYVQESFKQPKAIWRMSTMRETAPAASGLLYMKLTQRVQQSWALQRMST